VTDLQGDDLDFAVAKVMGWVICRTGVEHGEYGRPRTLWSTPDGKAAWRYDGEAPRSYSQDFGDPLREMLEWLTKRGKVQLVLDVQYGASADLKYEDLRVRRSARDGATLPEAVARLVVAVAERIKEAKP